MNKQHLNQLLMMAAAGYPDVLAVLVEMLRKYAAALGLMTPGLPEQLALDNGVGVTNSGVPVFGVVVKRRQTSTFSSQLAFGRAVQETLNEVAYSNCTAPLYLLRVQQLPGGFVGLTLTLGSW